MSERRAPSPPHSWKYPKQHVVVAGSQYRYRDIKFVKKKFEAMMSEVVEEAREVLMKDLLLVQPGQEAPPIPFDTILDDSENEEPKYSFLKHHQTRLPIDGNSGLTLKVWRNSALKDKYLNKMTLVMWNPEPAKEYLESLVKFKGLLLLAIHLWSAPCLRASQLLGIKHRNDAEKGLRNMFIAEGDVLMRCDDDVTEEKKREAPRMCSRKISELVIWYLWLVLPFAQKLEVDVLDKKNLDTCLLWGPDHDGETWTRSRFNALLKTYTQEKLRTTINLKAFKRINLKMLKDRTKQDFKSGKLATPDRLKEWDSDESYDSRDEEDEANEAALAKAKQMIPTKQTLSPSKKVAQVLSQVSLEPPGEQAKEKPNEMSVEKPAEA